jgi:hypothetical protein
MHNTAADNAMTKVENRSGLEDYFIAILEGLSLTNYHLGNILSFVLPHKLSFWKHSVFCVFVQIDILERLSLL